MGPMEHPVKDPPLSQAGSFTAVFLVCWCPAYLLCPEYSGPSVCLAEISLHVNP